MSAMFGHTVKAAQAKVASPTQPGPRQEDLLKKRREGQISAGRRRGFRSTLLSPIGNTQVSNKNTLLG